MGKLQEKNLTSFFCILEINLEQSDSEPDPFVRVTEPKIRIRTTISRIPDTANNRTISSDIWSVGEESIAIFQFITWHASSEFFQKFKQNPSEKSSNEQKDVSNATTFNTALFSLVNILFQEEKKMLHINQQNEKYKRYYLRY